MSRILTPPSPSGQRPAPLTAHWSVWAAGLLAVAVLAWTLWQPTQSFDDAYITYRYAQNLAAGHGFVYNAGERVLGTTAPFYALLLAGLSWLWRDIPTLSFVVGGLGWAGLVFLVYTLGRQAGAPMAGLLAAGLIAADVLLNSTLGMETTVYVALCLLALSLHLARRPGAAGLAAGLAFGVRWDGILVMAVIGLAAWLRERRWPWRAVLGWLVVAAPWLIFSQLYFGSVFPNTFFAKVGQAQSGLTGGGADPFGLTLLHLAQARLAADPVFAAWLPLGLLGFFNGRRWLATLWPMLLWAGIYVAGYVVLGVIGFHWYYAPLMPVLALLVGGGVVGLAGRLAPRRRWAAALTGAGLAALCLWPQLHYLWLNRPTASAHVASYQLVSDWLNAHTPADSSVALLEIGVIGYATQRPVVDMMGLVTPSMVGHLQSWDQAFYYAVTHKWPDYVVVLQGMAWSREPLPEPLNQIYTQVTSIANPADGSAPILIYQRRGDFPPQPFVVEWAQGLVYDQLFTLESLLVGSATLTPGHELALRLNWSVGQAVSANYQFGLEMVDLSSGRRVELRPLSQPFAGGAPTAQWRPGDHFAEDWLVRLPDDLPPGTYRLVLRATRDNLAVEPADSVTGQTRPAMSGPLTTQAPAPTPEFEPAPVSFGPDLRLLGRQLTPTGENQLQLTLFWTTANPPAGAATIFVHVFDGEQQLLGQDDSQPAGGALPITLWNPGVVVQDAHTLTLTGPRTPGSQICVGLYDPVTLTRLEVAPAAGYAVHDNEACWVLAKP